MFEPFPVLASSGKTWPDMSMVSHTADLECMVIPEGETDANVQESNEGAYLSLMPNPKTGEVELDFNNKNKWVKIHSMNFTDYARRQETISLSQQVLLRVPRDRKYTILFRHYQNVSWFQVDKVENSKGRYCLQPSLVMEVIRPEEQ